MKAGCFCKDYSLVYISGRARAADSSSDTRLFLHIYAFSRNGSPTGGDFGDSDDRSFLQLECWVRSLRICGKMKKTYDTHGGCST